MNPQEKINEVRIYCALIVAVGVVGAPLCWYVLPWLGVDMSHVVGVVVGVIFMVLIALFIGLLEMLRND